MTSNAGPDARSPTSGTSRDFQSRASVNPFAAGFRRKLVALVGESGASRHKIAIDGNINGPYLHRLYHGTKSNPSIGTVLKICLGLYATGNVSHAQLDELLMSAGFTPIYAVNDSY